MGSTPDTAVAPRGLRPVAGAIGVLVLVVVVFAVIRVRTDLPAITAGRVPDDDFAERYVAHPWVAYLHIAPGVIYLLGAPLQLARGFRTRHYGVHRRLGRVLVGCGLVSGVLAVAFGLLLAWGRWVESTAALVFGTWFVICLVLALRAIRRGEVVAHRRWMVRAFAVGVGIGTIRLWVGLLTAVVLTTTSYDGPFPEPVTFGVAFWLALPLHVALGEWWLRRTPALTG